MAIKPEVLAAPPEPEQQVAPPKPKGTGCLRVLKQMHREYVAAGGTPIYQ